MILRFNFSQKYNFFNLISPNKKKNIHDDDVCSLQKTRKHTENYFRFRCVFLRPICLHIIFGC